jgi:Citrate synthase, C-terminal domain
MRSPGQDDRRSGRGWRLASLVLLGLVVAAVVVLELWESPPGWLRGPRGLVVDGLHWVRVHWLTSGALGVLATLLGFGCSVGSASAPSARGLPSRPARRPSTKPSGHGKTPRLGRQFGETRWYDTSVRVQETVMEEKSLYPNVDFYTASVLSALGLPPDLYTSLFAVARMAGWTAHIREQYAD